MSFDQVTSPAAPCAATGAAKPSVSTAAANPTASRLPKRVMSRIVYVSQCPSSLNA